jgi:hypothetical protein
MSRTPRTQVEVAELTARILDAKNHGLTFLQIAAREGISNGYTYKLYLAGLHDIPRESADELREKQLTRIHAQREVLQQIVDRAHVTVNQGRVISTDDGELVIDDGPVMAAVDRLIKLDDQEARLLGLNAPVKTQTDVESHVRYTIIGADPGDVV